MSRRPSIRYAAITGAVAFTMSASHVPFVFLFVWEDHYSVSALGLTLSGLVALGIAAIVGLSIEIHRGLKSLFRLNGA